MSARIKESTTAAEQGLCRRRTSMLSQAFEPPRRVLSFGRNLSCNLTARASSVRASVGRVCHAAGTAAAARFRKSPKFEVSLRRTADYEQHMGWTITRNTLDAWGHAERRSIHTEQPTARECHTLGSQTSLLTIWAQCYQKCPTQPHPGTAGFGPG
jgi:hypothetical protein